LNALTVYSLTHSLFALGRVLAGQPENVLARAGIARVYLMLAGLRTSRQEFQTVSNSEELLPSAAPIASNRRPC